MGVNTGVKYIGKEAVYEDNILGTGLTWSKGETHILPVVMAKEFLKHSSMFLEVPGFSYVNAISSDLGLIVGARNLAGRNILMSVSSNQTLHHLELLGTKRARSGPDFVCDVDGNHPLVNHVGRVMRGKTHEMIQMGLNRIENLARPMTDNDGTYGWAPGTNTAVTVLDEPDFDGDKEIYRVARNSGSGVLMTYRSRQYTNGSAYSPNKWYEPGMYVCSFEARSASAYPIVVSAINNTDSAVLGAVTFTPDGEFNQDRRVFFAFTINARTQYVKVQFSCATSGALVLDIQRFQIIDKTGQVAVPSKSVKFGKDYGAGATGVRYFKDTDHYTDLGGGLCKPNVSPTLIPSRTQKGYAISPPWTNKFLHSDDFSNAIWDKVAVQLGTAGDSVGFGPSTMQRLELDATANTLHEIKQAFNGVFTQNKSTTVWFPYAAGTWATFEIGFYDCSGTARSASVDLATRATISIQGAPDPHKVHFIPAGLLCDKPVIGFTASSGAGSSAPIGFIRFAKADGTSASVGAGPGDQGKGSWLGRASFAHVDLPVVPMSVTTTASISGSGTGTNSLALAQAIPSSDFTIIFDLTIYDDDSNPCRSAWVSGAYWVDPSRVTDDTVTPNLARADVRGGTARRPGAWGGAKVEGFTDPNTGQFVSGVMKHVSDFYSRRSGKRKDNNDNWIWEEIFSVVMADVQFKAGSTMRVYFSVGPANTGNGSNLLMRVSGQAGVFDINSHAQIEALPAGQVLRLGYNAQAGSAISLQAFKNLEIRSYAMTAIEMAQHWSDNPLYEN